MFRIVCRAAVLPALLAVLCYPGLAVAQEARVPPPSSAGGSGNTAEGTSTPEQIKELQRQLEVLAAEVEKLRSGEPEQIPLTDARRRALGIAPSASAVYRRAGQGVSLAGYGEMLLENYDAENERGAANAPTTRFDFLRAVLYAGYRFNDRFLFNSELEIEHGNEMYVEFAYVDFQATDNITLRGGLVLIPLGLVNELHEPNVFLGARRPETEQRIIPSTWRENGAGVLTSFGPVNVRAYVTNGFNGAGFTSAGLRGGRQRGIQARAAHMALSSRADVTIVPGVFAGAGFYVGGSGQEQVVLGTERLDVGTRVVEVHAQAQLRGFDLRGLFAQASVDQAAEASLALRLPLGAPIADTMQGGYVQGGYNVLSQFGTVLALIPYVRWEQVDTQHRVPVGFTRDLTRDGRFATLGLDVKPIPNIVLKTEYQWLSNAAGTGRNQFNINLGYSF